MKKYPNKQRGSGGNGVVAVTCKLNNKYGSEMPLQCSCFCCLKIILNGTQAEPRPYGNCHQKEGTDSPENYTQNPSGFFPKASRKVTFPLHPNAVRCKKYCPIFGDVSPDHPAQKGLCFPPIVILVIRENSLF